MKIKRLKDNFVINTLDNEVLFLLDKDSKVETADYRVVLNTTDKAFDSNSVISSPGEYELADILFSVYNSDGDLDKPGVAVLDTDESVKVVFIGKNVENISKGMMEIMSDTDVLIMELDNDKVSKQLEKLNEVEPQMFIPIIDKDKIELVSKELGVGDIEELAMLKISQSDFTDPGSDTKVYFLKR